MAIHDYRNKVPKPGCSGVLSTSKIPTAALERIGLEVHGPVHGIKHQQSAQQLKEMVCCLFSSFLALTVWYKRVHEPPHNRPGK